MRLDTTIGLIPLRDHPVERVSIDSDLLRSFEEAEVLQEPPDDPVCVSVLDAAKNVMLVGGRRSALKASAPSRIRYRLVPSPRS